VAEAGDSVIVCFNCAVAKKMNRKDSKARRSAKDGTQMKQIEWMGAKQHNSPL
jgi:hypothetical protein